MVLVKKELERDERGFRRESFLKEILERKLEPEIKSILELEDRWTEIITH